jgi:hypothetical protein
LGTRGTTLGTFGETLGTRGEILGTETLGTWGATLGTRGLVFLSHSPVRGLFRYPLGHLRLLALGPFFTVLIVLEAFLAGITLFLIQEPSGLLRVPLGQRFFFDGSPPSSWPARSGVIKFGISTELVYQICTFESVKGPLAITRF